MAIACLSLLGIAAPAKADIITYILSGTNSGKIGATTFTNALITLSITGNTDAVIGAGSGIFDFEFMTAANPSFLSTGTDEFVFRIGMGNESTFAPSYGAWFEYDRTISPNWLCVCGFGSPVRIDSGIAVRTYGLGFQDLKIRIDKSRTKTDFYIGGVLVGTNTTITIAGSLEPFAHLIRVAGTSDRRFYIDYIGLHATWVTVRP